ncbi:MAG: hypothetical protein HQK55_06050 [Deltaproteobacteria bacterium]|nr:hypothetical protein [Deltaproteobacteria bacterium]
MAKLKPCPIPAEEIERIASTCRLIARDEDPEDTPKQARNKLKKFSKTADRLIKIWDTLDVETRFFLDRDIIDSIAKISAMADRAAEEINVKTGRNHIRELSPLLELLVDSWMRHTSKLPATYPTPKGPFYRLVDDSLKRLDVKVYSAQALASAIRRYIEQLKKSSK